MRLQVVEPALDEVTSAIQHYRAISVSLAADFASEFNRSLALITSQPRALGQNGLEAIGTSQARHGALSVGPRSSIASSPLCARLRRDAPQPAPRVLPQSAVNL